MVRRIPGMLLVAVGAVFLIWTFAVDFFSVGPAFDAMSDDFRPLMTDEAIATAEQDIAGLRTVSQELSTAALPTLAGALGISPEEMGQMTATEYPAVAAGVAALPAVIPTFEGVIATLDAQQSNFEQADAIPTASLPTGSVPWSLVIVGVLVAGLGAWFIVRPTQLDASIAVLAGVALVAVPLILSMPGKAGAADDLNAALEPVYTAEMVAGGQQALAVVNAMATQMQTEMLPTLAAQLQLDAPQVEAFLAENLPATAAAMTSLPGTMGRFEAMVDTFDANLGNYELLRPVAFTPIAWMMIVGGLITIIGGALPLLVERFHGEPLHLGRPHAGAAA